MNLSDEGDKGVYPLHQSAFVGYIYTGFLGQNIAPQECVLRSLLACMAPLWMTRAALLTTIAENMLLIAVKKDAQGLTPLPGLAAAVPFATTSVTLAQRSTSVSARSSVPLTTLIPSRQWPSMRLMWTLPYNYRSRLAVPHLMTGKPASLLTWRFPLDTVYIAGMESVSRPNGDIPRVRRLGTTACEMEPISDRHGTVPCISPF
ncbi:hypothetical protein J3F83DRAFT_751208 [Trichoderma novae-zelandiae]